MKVTSKHTTYGSYPEAACKVQELSKYAKKTKFLEKLIKQCRTDAEERDHQLVKKIAAGSAKRVKHHPTYAYLDNRIAKLNASRVTINNHVDFILAGNPISKKEIRNHLYHTLIASDCNLWFTLNECHDRPKFWTNRYLKKINLPNYWKITNVKEKTVAERGLRGNKHNPKLIRSTLVASNGTITKTITHYHYANWIDHRPAPSEKLLLKCAKIAVKHLRTTTNSPVGINCKAGVGRTGILANLIYGMQYIQNKLEAGKKLKKISINPAELNYDLRRQRKGLVSHSPQFTQVCKVLGTFAKKVPL